MSGKKIKTILILGLFALISNLAFGASDIKKVKRLVARLQMEILELKEKASNSASEQMSVLEPQNEKIESLTKENLELSKNLKDLELKFLLLEEKLEKYKQESSSEKLSELNKLATILTLISVGENSAIEDLVLELINQGNNIKQDLLVLLLADSQKKQGSIEESLNSYILLISEYQESDYRPRAIFEASELLGKLGHIEDQNSMLEALKDLDSPFGVLAREKLGISEPVNSLQNSDKENQEKDEPEQNQKQEVTEDNKGQAETDQIQEKEVTEDNKEQAETDQIQEKEVTEDNKEQDESDQIQEKENSEEDNDSDY